MADKESIYGIKYEVDIEELKTSTQEAGKNIKMANAIFNESSSKLDNWANSTEGVSEKLKQLNSVMEAQKAKLANLKNEYNGNIDKLTEYDNKIAELKEKKQKSIEQYGKESKEVEKLSSEIAKLEREQQATINKTDQLSISILNQQTKVNKTQKETEKYTAKLDELQNSSKQTASATDKLKSAISEQEGELNTLKKSYADVVLEQGKSSDEAQKLASKIRELNGNLQQNKSKLNEVESEAKQLTDTLEDTGKGAEESGEGFTIMKGALADVVGNAITGAVSKVGELVGSLFELSEATEEYRTMNAKLEGSANTFGYSVDFAKEKYKDLYGYLNDDQMATNAITNLMGLGASTDTVSSIVDSAIGVWSAYGDSIPIEGLTESINETAQVGKVTGSLADALNWAGISEDDFNKKLESTNGTKERAQLIADTLNAKYGESKKTYDELTGSITEANRAELELKESQAELGQAIEPVNTAINNMKAKALDLVAPAVEFFASKFLDLNNYMKENPAVMNVVIALVISLATAFGVLAGALAIQGIITGVTKAIALLNTTLLANPIVLIITAITALVAGFIYLWNTSDSFRNFWIELWNNIVEFVGGAIDGIVNFFTVTIPEAFENFKNKCQEITKAVGQFFVDLWNGIVSFFTETIPAWIQSAIEFFKQLPNYIGYMIGFIIGKFIAWKMKLVEFVVKDIPEFIKGAIEYFQQLPGKIAEHLSNAIKKIADWVVNTVNKGKEAGSKFLDSVISFFKQLPGKIWEFLKNATTKVIEFGSDLANKGKEAGRKLLDKIVGEVEQIPSKMKSIGKDVVKGLWNGINDMIDWVVGKVKGFGKSVLNGIKDALGVHSPSRETYWMGEMMNKGLINAITHGTKKVVKKAKTMASNVIGTMKDTLGEKITVGYDLVENLKGKARNTISNLLTSMGAGELAYAGATSNVNNVTFNQYNTSPKAIDSLETYRNTQKQLKLFKKWKG